MYEFMGECVPHFISTNTGQSNMVIYAIFMWFEYKTKLQWLIIRYFKFISGWFSISYYPNFGNQDWRSICFRIDRFNKSIQRQINGKQNRLEIGHLRSESVDLLENIRLWHWHRLTAIIKNVFLTQTMAMVNFKSDY